MRRTLLAVVVVGVIGTLSAKADTTITFVNKSGKTVYIYSATAANGADIDCGQLAGGSELASGATWSTTVPTGRYGWVKFQRTAEGGCGIGNNEFETKIFTTKENKSDTVDVT